jgi:hypothetical protein
VGKGLWATATPPPPSPKYFEAIDAARGQVVYWGAASEGGQLVILGVRLKAEDALITEIETQVIRRPPEGGHPRVFAPEAMLRRNQAFFDEVAGAKQTAREQMIRCANLYLDGILTSNGGMIPVHRDCVRIENGVQTVLNEGRGEDMGALGVADQINSGIFRDIETARERRVLAIDDERGLIVLAFLFDHPGPVTKSSFQSRFEQPNSMAAFEVFKIRGGLIVRIESVLNVFPYGMRSGWA